MKLLVIGGTRFLGRHLTEIALAEGHEVTLFHRGKTGADLFPGAEHVLGDRDGGLEKLNGRRWDAAIDTCGYVPRLVRAAAGYLADKVEHYTFVSSISVYRKFTHDMDESAEVATLDDPTTEEITGETYGALKALCETAAERAMPGRVLIARSGLIVGPYDPTDRFTYWVRRIATGGRYLAPAPPEAPVQVIHAADQAAWFLRMAEGRRTGVFNVTGPREPVAMGDLFRICREVSGSNAEPEWVPVEFLVERKAELWNEIPLVPPPEEGGILAVNIDRALRDGLTFRSTVQVVRETLAWDMSRPPGTTLKSGLTADREAKLLTAWDARSGG
jgi:2'-hydroxyisoflavone reductase